MESLQEKSLHQELKSIVGRDSYDAGKNDAGSRITIGTKLFFRWQQYNHSQIACVYMEKKPQEGWGPDLIKKHSSQEKYEVIM